jgi:hypothetical protein
VKKLNVSLILFSMRSDSKNYNEQHNCAHAWAHQLSPAGHASNFYFEGPTIYSYGGHFPIATLDGDRVFFTTKGYSSSTAQHKAKVRSAVSHLKIIFVEHVPVTSDLSPESGFIRKNIDAWVADIKELVSTVERHPKRTSIYHEINTALSRLTTFIAELNITPDAALQQLLEHPSLQTIVDHQAALKIKATEAEKKRLALLSKFFVAVLKAWRTELFNTGSLHNPEDGNLAYLRWNEKTCCVETSKGIHVPVEVAKRCYDFVQSKLPSGCTACNFSLLSFQVTSITPEFLTVGCHKIPMTEVSAIALQLGW